MPKTGNWMHKSGNWRMPLLFVIARFVWALSVSPESLRGFGDLGHFFRLAAMGMPFRDYWVEFPPLFPFLSTVIYHIAGGQEHVYDTLLVFLLSVAQAGCLWIFAKICQQVYPQEKRRWRELVYFCLSLGLAYTWWYFDPLATLAMLAGLLWIIQKRDTLSGTAIGIGFLVKLFPILLLAPMLGWRGLGKTMRTATISLAIILPVLGGLYLLSPEMTRASLLSQFQKGSWETPWALLDGNFRTGNFIGPEGEHYDASRPMLTASNPRRVPAWLSLVPFSVLGLWLTRRLAIESPLAVARFLGIAMCIFFLWSPGWSPQWVLYLLPVVLLSLPVKEGTLFALCLLLINLLEWPILLSRGYFGGLWITVLLRAALLAVLGARLVVLSRQSSREKEEVAWKVEGRRCLPQP